MTPSARYLRRSFTLAACILLATGCDRVQDLPGLLLPSVAPSGQRPSIIASSPAQGATAATAGTEIYVEFDRDMDLESTRNAFSLSGSASAAGNLRFAGRRVYYDLEDSLVPGNSYTLRVAGSAESNDGVSMQIDYLVFFSVGTATNAPTLLSSTPANNAQGVAVTSAIVMNFSRAMNRQSVENAFSISPTAAGAFSWGASDTQLTYTPFADLNFATTYSVTLSVGATDTEGISLSTTNNFSFQVGTDFTKPTVTDIREVGNIVALADLATGVYKDSAFIITFDEAMSFSPTQSAFSLTRLDNSTTVAGVLNWNATFTQLTFTPNDPLEPSRQYRLRVTTGAQDAAGNALDTQLTRTFTVDNTGGAVNSNYLTVTAMQKSAPGAVQAITLSPAATTT
ncbi:MAG: Ig-like domain-containing protein, partial [Leptospirales bacterium]